MTDYRYAVSREGVHQLCSWNRTAIQKSDQCGCFYCCGIFPATAVTSWIDPIRKGHGVTAVCPRCDIDSVVPDASIAITPGLLVELHCYYFWPLKRIRADFNAVSEDGLMRLNTRGALEDLESTGARVGERVLLTMDEDVPGEGIGVVAVLVEQVDKMYGRFDWDAIFDLDAGTLVVDRPGWTQ